MTSRRNSNRKFMHAFLGGLDRVDVTLTVAGQRKQGVLGSAVYRSPIIERSEEIRGYFFEQKGQDHTRNNGVYHIPLKSMRNISLSGFECLAIPMNQAREDWFQGPTSYVTQVERRRT